MQTTVRIRKAERTYDNMLDNVFKKNYYVHNNIRCHNNANKNESWEDSCHLLINGKNEILVTNCYTEIENDQ